MSNDQKKRFISQTLAKIFKINNLFLLACAAKETNELGGETIKGHLLERVSLPLYNVPFAEMSSILEKCDIYVTLLFFCIIFGEQCLTKGLNSIKLGNLEVATAVNALWLLSLLINYHNVVLKREENMKKILLGSTALVAAGMIASAPASAKMKLSVGGYMEQWVGYVSQDDVGTADYSGVDVKSDSEVHFKGMVKLDNGMSVGVNMQLEGNGGGDTIDESYLIVKGGFGEINLGSENSALYKMHYSAKGYGIGFNSGDQSSWVNTGGSISQSGHFRQPMGSTNIEPNGMNDSEKITYYTPRVNGFQLGVSYAPWAGEDGGGQFDRNANKSDYVTAGANYQGRKWAACL